MKQGDHDRDFYENFSLVTGGLVYDLMGWLRRDDKDPYAIWPRAIFFGILTWLPLFLLALLDGSLSGNKVEINFLEDFTVHLRFLFVVPFLILMERMIDHSFRDYVKTTEHIIEPDQTEDFRKVLITLKRLTKSYLPEILILVFIYLQIILRWNDLSIFDASREFLVKPDANKLSPAGWYYLLLSFPFYQLLIFRWIWRWMIWFYSLVRFSRLTFKIESLHADQMGGLQYLNLVPFAFSFLFLAPSAALAGTIGIEILFRGTMLTDYLVGIVVYVVTLPLILYLPLLIFTPKLMKIRSWGVHWFGTLITQHNNAYVEKWIKGGKPEHEKLLGSMDNSSLADINGSYTAIQNTKIVPVNYKQFILSVILTMIPFIPLLFTYYSGMEMLKRLMESLFGS